jgi:hypothetical protein
MNFIKEGNQGNQQDNKYGYFLVFLFFADQVSEMILTAVIQIATGVN